jgi:signal transduction histidine kinase
MATRFDQFLDGVEHDLRNPLNTLGMTIALLGRGNPSPDTVSRGERAVDRMTEMGDQLVAFLRITLGSGLPLRLEGARLDDLVRSVVNEQPRVRFDESAEGQGRWDVELVQRAVKELVSNAIDHGGEGPITVRASSDGTWATVSVESSNPVADWLRDGLLFDPVERAAKQRVRPVRGLGLGLYLARQIARAHGGDCTLESADGPTRFQLKLPAGDASGKVST